MTRPAPRYFHSTPSLPSDTRRVPAAPSKPFATPLRPFALSARRHAARGPFRLLRPRIRPASTPFPALFRGFSGVAEPLFSPTVFGYPDFFVYL